MNMIRKYLFLLFMFSSFTGRRQNRYKQNPNIYVSARIDQWIKAKTVPRGKQ